jgi:V/A-type H+-transporting ATPase subunit F
MKIAAFCDNDTAVGLRLAGIKDLFISNDNNFELWKQIKEREDIGILFITEQISEDLKKYLKDFRLRNNIPIIVEIPDKKGKIKDHENFISHLIKKAVGIEVKK